jgi:glycosyltransferase involved in cell wall biosynthesis
MRLAMICLTGGDVSGGYRTYLQNMLPRLAAHRDVEALLCLAPERAGLPESLGPVSGLTHAPCRPLGARHLVREPDRLMQAALAAFAPDIVFVSLGRYIRWRRVPTVVMLQNMEPFVPGLPGDPPVERCRKFLERRLAARAVRRADHTIAVSGFVREYLTKTLRVPLRRVSQVYYGMPPIGDAPRARPASVPREWDGEFLFTCGSVRPARGLEDAVAALGELRQRGRPVQLVIAGAAVPRLRSYQSHLQDSILRRGLAEQVRWTNYISGGELAWCYEHCAAFLMTSRVESFGMIGLEAMAHGCLCVAADNPCLPELFGQAAMYYHPGDGTSLADRIEQVHSWTEEEKAQMASAARARAAEFSWDAATDATVAVLLRTVRDAAGIEGSVSR